MRRAAWALTLLLLVSDGFAFRHFTAHPQPRVPDDYVMWSPYAPPVYGHFHRTPILILPPDDRREWA